MFCCQMVENKLLNMKQIRTDLSLKYDTKEKQTQELEVPAELVATHPEVPSPVEVAL